MLHVTVLLTRHLTSPASEGSLSSFPVPCLPWTQSWPCTPWLSLPSSQARIFSLDYFFSYLAIWTNYVQVQWVPRTKRGAVRAGKAYLLSVMGSSYISLSHLPLPTSSCPSTAHRADTTSCCDREQPNNVPFPIPALSSSAFLPFLLLAAQPCFLLHWTNLTH